MDIILQIINNILQQGLIYGILAIGVYITYHILDFPDLTVDGSFPLGGAVTVLMLHGSIGGYLALIVAFLAGAMAGLLTGLLHVKLKISNLLSGILTMTALLSINLKIAGAPIVSLFGKKTIFNTGLATLFPPALRGLAVLLTILILVLVIKYIFDAYLHTKHGYLLIAVGDNPQIVTSVAVNPQNIKIIGLMLANGLVALAGSVMAQWTKTFDYSIGMGTIVIGLASVIMGMMIFKRAKRVAPTTKVVFGAILYYACLAIALQLGLPPYDLKIVMAVIFTAVLVLNSMSKRRKVNVKVK